ncbi:MAG: PQQ-dependent sugar dehydrogenase [Hyphomonas sp.]|uniref:PQQ-dependent sugar dehydrogenase n=1 Tax=Hyphomonas sp. TaxID=87 RepID=UPI003529843E
MSLLQRIAQKKRHIFALLAITVAVSFVCGLVAAAMILKPEALRSRIFRNTPAPPQLADTVELQWTKVETALLTLQKAEVPLGNIDGHALGGAIEQFGNHIIYAATSGKIVVYNPGDGTIGLANAEVPINWKEVRNAPFIQTGRFNLGFFRLLDLLVWPQADGQADLFVSYHLYKPQTEEICTVVDKASIEIIENDLVFTSPEWDRVYEVNACISLPDSLYRFDGLQSGGRLLQGQSGHLLLSVGDFDLPGVLHDYDIVQSDSGNDYSKLIQIDLLTGESEIYASGLRNPQGLDIAADGTIWEAEHGPQGGDEVNQLKFGHDYGWPNVTLGTDYGSPRKSWPLNDKQGRHEGYTRPALAFLPSVGTSGLAIVDATERLEHWKNDILLTTLRAESIFRMRPVKDQIIYAEQIRLGTRLRDIMVLSNGLIVLLSDDDKLVLLKEADAGHGSSQTISSTVTGYNAVADHEPPSDPAKDRLAWGEAHYMLNCSQCHRLDGETHIAPPLNGIVGAQIAGDEMYNYSTSLAAVKGKWTRSSLIKFLENPQELAPGTPMPNTHLNEYERAAIVDFLSEKE